MTTSEAREILGADIALDGWWGEYIDPSGTVHHDPRMLAEEALEMFRDKWIESIEGTGLDLDDVLDALEVAAGEAVESAPE